MNDHSLGSESDSILDATAPAIPLQPRHERERSALRLGGSTSDTLRSDAGRFKEAQRRIKKGLKSDELVKLEVKIPKGLRKEFRKIAKDRRTDPDRVVLTLIQIWLEDNR